MLFNYFYAPSMAASATLLENLAEGLAEHANVTVVTASEADPETQDRKVQCIRFVPRIFGIQGRMKRIVEYAYFCARTFLWLLFARLPPHTHCVFFTDPPFLDFWGGAICRLRGIRYSVSVFESFPDFGVSTGLVPDGPIARTLRSWQVDTLRKSASVTYISHDFQSVLTARGAPTGKVIEPWSDPALFPEVPLRDWRKQVSKQAQGAMVVRYSGNLGDAFDANSFFGALELLPNPERFLFVFQGGGLQWRELEERANRFSNVKLQPWVPASELVASLQACDLHMILTPANLYGCVFASKLFSILAAGRPVLASVPAKSSMHALIASENVGLSVDAGNAFALAAALERFYEWFHTDIEQLEVFATAGRRFTKQTWNRKIAVEAYVSTLLPLEKIRQRA